MRCGEKQTFVCELLMIQKVHPLLNSMQISHLRTPTPFRLSLLPPVSRTQTDRPVIAVDVIQPAALFDHLHCA